MTEPTNTSEHDDHIPADLTPDNESEIEAERARMFTLGFWKSLLAGREGMGDTFWAGITWPRCFSSRFTFFCWRSRRFTA